MAESTTRAGSDRGHIRALDGVRGIAILAVLVYHFLEAGVVLADQGRSPSPWIDRAIVRVVGTGWTGVDLFFVLSGFLITRILLSAREGRGYFRSFYARRVLRIFPVYYALLFFLIVVLPYLPGFRGDADLTKLRHHQLEYWTYLSNVAVSLHPFVDRGNYVGQLWSLAVEEQFYLVWPALVLLLGRRGLGVFCILCIFAAPIMRYGLFHGAVPGMQNTFATLTLMPARMDALAIGGLVAVIAAEPSLLRRALPWAKVAGAIAALFLAVLFLKRGGLSGFDEPVLVLGFSALAVTFAAFLTVVIGGLEGSLQATCRARVLTFFGQYSYGLYIVHFVIMEQLAKRFSKHGGLPIVFGSSLPAGAGFAVLGIAISVALAWLSWHLFEKHFLKLKRFVPYGSEPRRPSRVPRGELSRVLATRYSPQRAATFFSMMERSMRCRRRDPSDAWHFRPDCLRWPKDGTSYEELEEWSGPAQGTLCNACRAYRDNVWWPKHTIDALVERWRDAPR